MRAEIFLQLDIPFVAPQRPLHAESIASVEVPAPLDSVGSYVWNASACPRITSFLSQRSNKQKG